MLQVLSERFAGLFLPILALAGVFVLTLQIVAEPSTHQIAMLGVYGVFALLLVALIRRRP